METNDSNTKPQQTGGLKLMTVFVIVLAAHVLVIGGVSAYYLLKGGSADADLVTAKNAKAAKSDSDVTMASDNLLPDAASTDKTTATPPASTDTASTPTSTPVPAPAEQTASTDTSAPSTETGPVTTTPTDAPPVAVIQRGPVIVPPQSQPQLQAPVAPALASAEVTTPPAIEPPVTMNGAPYVVKSGDSLAKIAHHNHTSVAKLKAANNLTSDMLHIGQKVIIPSGTQVASATAPSAGADASGGTTILGDSPATPSMNVSAPAAKTPATGMIPNASVSQHVASTHGHTYTVMKGDTLTKIAHKFKTTPTAIMTANNITDAAKLSIGKKLRIPSQESRSAVNTPRPTSAPIASPAAAATTTQESQPNEAPAKAETMAELANFVQ